MSKLLGTSEARDLSSSEADAQVLDAKEKGQVSAKMVWDKMRPEGASLPEMSNELRKTIEDDTEYMFALAGLMKLSNEAMDDMLNNPPPDDTTVLAEMNKVLDAASVVEKARESNTRLLDGADQRDAEDDVA